MKKNLSYIEAAELLEAQPVRLQTVSIPIDEALWHILAEDLYARFPMPPFDKSPFDGFAFRAADVPGTLTIRGESAAGCRVLEPLLPGTAMRIFTGAPVPSGADTIVKFEDTQVQADRVTVPGSLAPDTNIIHTGEDYAAGDLLVEAGTRLSAAEIGVLASQGLGCIPVYRSPKALFLSTGSELSEPGEERAPYGIYNSSYYSLSAYLRSMNFEVRRGGVVADDRALIEEKIGGGLRGEADLVITTGGASVGDYDFAVRAAEDLGMEILFWKVNMKPGGALMVARSGEKLYIALSGNPAAAMMSVLVVLQPYLRKLSGATIGNRELELPLLNPMPKFSTAVRMLRGHATIRDGRTFFEEHPGRGNGHIASFGHCNMIGVVPAGGGNLEAGTMVKVLRLPEDLCF
ncbi:MAG: molybdopterin molybdotransferase MoeA [Oscillospiraceae bacterium]|nr:molybdopterin molybdotransferase MoeA [Oscillospiraceae bacterium]